MITTVSYFTMLSKVVMDTGVVTAVGIHHGNPNVRRLTLSNLCQQIGDGQATEDTEVCGVSFHLDPPTLGMFRTISLYHQQYLVISMTIAIL